MPERRAASLVPETTEQRPAVVQWGTLAGDDLAPTWDNASVTWDNNTVTWDSNG